MNFTGRVLSSFVLGERLGQGAMGLVYKAVHEKTAQVGAVKFIDAQSSHLGVDSGQGDLQTLVNRFCDEAKAISSINNPFVVKILAVGQDRELGKYIIMECLDGESLEDSLQKGPLQSELFRKLLAKPLLQGLSEMHRARVLHRDIKPANLIADSTGIYKISDFGLAIFKDRTAKTKTGVIVGTPGYLAPELFSGNVDFYENGSSFSATKLSGKSPLPFLSDLYSAGVVLTEALCGENPFRSPNLGETVRKQLNDTLTGSSLCSIGRKHGASVFPSVAKVLARSLATNPKARFQNCDEFLNALEDAFKSGATTGLGSENITICPDGGGIMGQSTKIKSPRGLVRKDPRLPQPKPKATSSEQTLPKKRLPFKGIALLFLCVVFLAFGVVNGFNITGFLSPGKPASFVETQEFETLSQDFSQASKTLAKEGSFPTKDGLQNFFDNGLAFYSYLAGNDSISPRDQARQWKLAIDGLKGAQASIAQSIPRSIGGGESAFKASKKALILYREAFSLSYKGSVSSRQFSNYLDGDSWLFEQVLLALATSHSGLGYFETSHKLIIGSERFLCEILPSVPELGGSDRQSQNAKVPPLWDEAVKYRLKLFLWRGMIFSCHSPLTPYSSFIDTKSNELSQEEYVSSVDSGNAIFESVKYLLSRGIIQEDERAEVQKLTDEMLKVLEDDESYGKAVSASEQIISETKDAPDGFIDAGKGGSLYTLLEFNGNCIRDTEFAVNSFTGMLSNLHLGSAMSKKKKKRVQCSVVVGRRTLWYTYPIVVLENTMLQRNTDLRKLPDRFLDYLRSFLRYVEGRDSLDPFVDINWLGLGINELSLSEMAVNIAGIPLKAVRPELIFPSKGNRDGLSTLNWYESYSVAVGRLFYDIGMLSKKKRDTKKNDGRFNNSLELFCSRWDDYIFPMVPDKSLLYYSLGTSRFILGKSQEVSPTSRAKSLEMSKAAFEIVRELIEKAGGNSCLFSPYIRLLVSIIEERWVPLRESNDLDSLLAEALWVQNTFAKTIEVDMKNATERGLRSRLFCSAVSNVGHVYLARGDKELYLKQLPFVKLGKKIIADPGSALLVSLQSIIEGRTLN